MVMNFGELVKGRYKWTRKSDGKLIVEIRTDKVAKTRKAFAPSDVQLFETTKVVVK